MLLTYIATGTLEPAPFDLGKLVQLTLTKEHHSEHGDATFDSNFVFTPALVESTILAVACMVFLLLVKAKDKFG